MQRDVHPRRAATAQHRRRRASALATRSGALHTQEVQTPGIAFAAACAALLLTGCGVSSGGGASLPDQPSRGPSTSSAPGGSANPSGSAAPDAATLVERALAARSANAPAEFAELLTAASRACPDPDAGRRLGEVAAIAARWSSALLDGRPKAQKVTEEQLAIAFERMHSTTAALAGLSAVFLVTYLGGAFYADLFIFSFERGLSYINWEVIFLVMGMMILIAIIEGTGIFQWTAFQAYRISQGRIWLLVLILMVVTAVASALLDNFTTMLLMTPISLQIALALGINPLALIIPEVLASNVGGISTLVGTPTNIIIGAYAGIGFSERLYALHDDLFDQARDLVAQCPCTDGCPSCVGPAGEMGWGGKAETLALLQEMAR